MVIYTLPEDTPVADSNGQYTASDSAVLVITNAVGKIFDSWALTGYNTGTYYKDVTDEKWREFEEIYDEVQEAYEPFFSKFPWIITEFSSSSIGGDKAAWINTMFDKIGDYKNIKIAVWFSYADYDFRSKKNKTVARPYWINETPQTTEVFRRGLKKNSIAGW